MHKGSSHNATLTTPAEADRDNITAVADLQRSLELTFLVVPSKRLGKSDFVCQ